MTSVPLDELIKALDLAISKQLEDRILSFKKAGKGLPGYNQRTMVTSSWDSGRKGVSGSGQL